VRVLLDMVASHLLLSFRPVINIIMNLCFALKAPAKHHTHLSLYCTHYMWLNVVMLKSLKHVYITKLTADYFP
jgi:hypothetical protein